MCWHLIFWGLKKKLMIWLFQQTHLKRRKHQAKLNHSHVAVGQPVHLYHWSQFTLKSDPDNNWTFQMWRTRQNSKESRCPLSPPSFNFMSTICLFWEGSHESQQACGLNKDHCFTAGTKGGPEFLLAPLLVISTWLPFNSIDTKEAPSQRHGFIHTKTEPGF